MLHSMDVAKTHEIMARFRPIAPKPAPPPDGPDAVENPSSAAAAAALHLRARPCRARKRARAALAAASATGKRHKTFFPMVFPCPDASQPLAGISVRSFGHGFPVFPLPGPEKPTGSCADLLTLSLLPGSASLESAATRGVPVEQDLLQKLQEPKVIVPQPVRPVGSSISVGCISQAPTSAALAPVSKRPEEVEEEVESEALPAVVSDSNNRVRLANSAYKEMVGQPECPWLDSMVLGVKASSSPRRIGGEVMLDLSDPSALPACASGFSCRAKIEWACNGRRSVVDASCDVVRLCCESKDYLFTWRFRTTEASATNCKA